MADVLHLKRRVFGYEGLDGLFWQISWRERLAVADLPELTPGRVKIHVGELLALLITCETFAYYCAGLMTTCRLDNTVAQAWFEAARCPKYPYDRCAQGTHLYMLDRSMKISTVWVPSSANAAAERFSRERFVSKQAGHVVAGQVFGKIRPKWHHVTRLLFSGD